MRLPSIDSTSNDRMDCFKYCLDYLLSNEWLLASLIVILLYTTKNYENVEAISAPTLRRRPWFLKYNGSTFWLVISGEYG